MKSTREQLREKFEMEIVTLQGLLDRLDSVPGLDKITIPATNYGNQIDFDNLSRADVEDVLRNVGGKWNKVPEADATVTYTSEVNGMALRMWRGQPPPNCKIVEVLETIPAQPERVVTVRKLQCV